MGVRRESITQSQDPEREALQAYLNSQEYRDYLKERAKNRSNQLKSSAGISPIARSMQQSASRGFMKPGDVQETATAFADRAMEEQREAERTKKAMQTQIALYKPNVRAPAAENKKSFEEIRKTTNWVTGTAFAGGSPGEVKPLVGQPGFSADAFVNKRARQRLAPWVQDAIENNQIPRGLWDYSSRQAPHQQLMPTTSWNQLAAARLAQRQSRQLPLKERLARIRAQKPGYINPLLEQLGLKGGIL